MASVRRPESVTSLGAVGRRPGGGVIISPRDLAPHKAREYAPQYVDKGAHVLIDQQFYVPDSDVGKLSSYEVFRFRASVAGLGEISDADMAALSAELQQLHTDLGASGVIAPALIYQAGRPDIVDVNGRLFTAAKAAGDALGIPTYATVVFGLSASSSDATMNEVLSQATRSCLTAPGFGCIAGSWRV